MPSTLPVSTIGDFVAAFHRGVRAKRDKRADGHSGSAYDYVAGTTAMLLARESAYVRDLFQALYFGVADGDDLTALASAKFGITRITDGYGTGTTTLVRPNALGADGTIWAGTRVLVLGASPTPLVYAVAQDTPIAASATYAAGVPIRATKYGAGTAIDTTLGGVSLRLDDPLWDNTWAPTSLVCGDGTVFEQAPQFRARVLATLRASLVGYATGMANACIAAGAANVTIFGCNFGGVDLGGCAVYVGDASYNGSTALVQACTLALESWRMLGSDPLIGPMVSTALPITATVQLYDSPAKFDTGTLASSITSAIRRQFSASASYGYDLDALFGAVVETTDAIQNVTFTTPSSSQGLLVGSPPWFPQSLPRYFIPPSGIALAFVGPS
jgi:hypothetical protein